MELLKTPETLKPEECAGVAFFAEHEKGEIASVTLELAGEGRRLADALGQQLHAFVLGHDLASLAEELRHYAIDQVHVIDAEALGAFQDETYSAALCHAVRQVKPAILLVGATTNGRSMAADAAARLGAGLVAGCTSFALDDDKNLIATRPAFGGVIYADVVSRNHRPQIATVRRKMLAPAVRKDETAGEINAIDPPGCAATPITKFLEAIEDAAGGVDLTGADIIVSGGRGIGGPEAFAMISDLAEAMGGAVGASRAAVDSGWIPYPHQVGQTGKQVKPKIYVACGISGAIQHLVGMRNADSIIAINRDPEAPIFKHATYGIVGDVHQIVPALAERFRRGG